MPYIYPNLPQYFLLTTSLPTDLSAIIIICQFLNISFSGFLIGSIKLPIHASVLCFNHDRFIIHLNFLEVVFALIAFFSLPFWVTMKKTFFVGIKIIEYRTSRSENRDFEAIKKGLGIKHRWRIYLISNVRRAFKTHFCK